MAVTTKLTYGGAQHEIHDDSIESLRSASNSGKYVSINANGETVATDVTTKCLALSGGTMTGDISLDDAYGMKRVNTSGATYIQGGTGTTDGASLVVHGNASSGHTGDFSLTAHDGSNSKELLGKPDGTLTWNGNSVLTVAGGTVTGNLTVNGTLTGTASKATADASGNVITSTYATKTEDAAKLPLLGGTMTGVLNDKQGYAVYGVPNTPEAHNGIYRGKEHSVSDLSEKVLANDFSDIFIGDYFVTSLSTTYGTVSSINFHVAAINYFQNCGDTRVTTPHLVMVPNKSLGAAGMNTSQTTTGGYAGSNMHTTVLPTIATALINGIGNQHVISHRRLLSNAVNTTTASMAGAGFTGATTGTEWVSCDMCLMSEPMVMGTTVFSSSGYDVTDAKQMFPLFRLAPFLVNLRGSYWLSAVASSNYFSFIHDYGYVSANYAASAYSIRPYFLFH